ncbi:MAG: hypothetical protein C4295_00015 [Candidatus Fervidibacterota bacterium]
MRRWRVWVNEHSGLVLLFVLVALSASGWSAYRYLFPSSPTAPSCCPLEQRYGPEGRMGGLLVEAGLKTLALDALRHHFPKKEWKVTEIRVTDAKKGLVTVRVRIEGKERLLQVDLRHPHGKVRPLTGQIELPK